MRGEMDTQAMRRLAGLPASQQARLAVVVSVEGSAYRGPGATRIWTPDGRGDGVVSGGCLEADLQERDLPQGRGLLVRYDMRGGPDDLWGLAAGCNGVVEVWLQPIPAELPSPYRSASQWLEAGVPVTVTTLLDSGEQWAVAAAGRGQGNPRPVGVGERVFVDRRQPAPLVLVYGRGADAGPVVDLLTRVGFRVRQAGRGDDLASLVGPQTVDAAVVMSHHFPGDQQALQWLAARAPRYLGVLGPRERTRRLLPEPWPTGLHAPLGLDVGADDAEEIAVSLVSEILAVLRGRSGGHLSGREGPIHPERARA